MKQTIEFVNGFRWDNAFALAAGGDIDFFISESETAAICGDHCYVVLFETEQDAIQHKAGFVR